MIDKTSSPITPWEKTAKIEIKEPYVTIPRAQYEALMALAEAALTDPHTKWIITTECLCGACVKRRGITAALRSAGIEETR